MGVESLAKMRLLRRIQTKKYKDGAPGSPPFHGKAKEEKPVEEMEKNS